MIRKEGALHCASQVVPRLAAGVLLDAYELCHVTSALDAHARRLGAVGRPPLPVQ